MKVAKSRAQKIKFSKSTTIFSYPSGSKSLSVARIKVNARHPQEDSTQFIEHECDVIFYVIQGSGKVVIEGRSYDLAAEDTITILKGKRYFVEGNLDYIASTSPAYSPNQNEIV